MTDTALAATASYATAPEHRVPLGQKLVYGLGTFVNSVLAAAIALIAAYPITEQRAHEGCAELERRRAGVN
jgi:hypothetical protein